MSKEEVIIEELIQAQQKLLMISGDIDACVLTKGDLEILCYCTLAELEALDKPTLVIKIVTLSIKRLVDYINSGELSNGVAVLLKVDDNEAQKTVIRIREEMGVFVATVGALTYRALMAVSAELQK